MNKIIYIVSISISLLCSSINMEGFYEGQFGRGYQSDFFEWNIWDPNYYLETRINGSPMYGSNFYIKFYADKDYTRSQRPLAVFSEGNIEFRNESNGNGFSSVFFSRESRHFWIDGSMLGIINTGSVNNDGNGQGGRFDLWHRLNGSLTYVFSDFSQGEGDDIHLLRYRQSLFKNKLNTGIFFQRKFYSNGAKLDYNEVIANDIKISLGRYYFTSEIALSAVPSDSAITELAENYQKENFLKSNIAIKSELRGIRFGGVKSGYWFINPGLFSYGDAYRNYMGDNQYNQNGYWINTYYLVPQRAITFVLNYSRFSKMIPDSTLDQETYDPTINLYSEMYIEFLNGFKGKVAFNKKDEVWQGNLYKHYDFFTELSVENQLAKLLAQFKIKDLGETWEKYIAGIELSVNLAEKWRIFTRGLVINDRVSARYSFFTELQYRTGGNAELYLQYGPSYWGQYGLVNDDGFASSGSMKKEVRLIIKGWF